MSDVVRGQADNPQALLEQVFNAIAVRDMRELPFYQPQIPVRACGFQLFDRQWIGTLLTPWMLCLLVLPGPEQAWERRPVGSRLALALPCGNVSFTVGEIDGCGQYLSSSLMSPLTVGMGAEPAELLAQQCARMALSLPVADADAPANPARRWLFGAGRPPSHA